MPRGQATGGAGVKKNSRKEKGEENVFSFTLFFFCGRIIMYDYA